MKMILIQSLFICLVLSCDVSPSANDALKYDYYVIQAPDEQNTDAADYLFYHLKKRSSKDNVFKEGDTETPTNLSKIQFIEVAIDPDLKSDYEIVRLENTLTLKANSKKTLYWLYYQYIQVLSQADKKIEGSDLPPAIVDFKSSKTGEFAFSYREPHLKANLVTDYDVLINTNNIDNEWGLWGHQLFTLANKDAIDGYYSVIGGKINKNQLCFSSTQLYALVENHIIDNFGEGEKEPQKFVISPADNALVCKCSACSKIGNSKDNATPAVMALIKKLASRFPNHQFFTLDYLSVKTPPIQKLPENIGVIISSIDLPRKVNFEINNKNVKIFESKVNKWHQVTSNVYVWDYISNFDDYLTPYPSLAVAKSTFSYYKNLKINGIFANGAGYDYSTFNSVHTYVLAALMQDPNLDISTLVSTYCDFYYGDAGKSITNYILKLEKNVQSRNTSLDLYSSLKKPAATYLEISEFFKFYESLEKSISKSSGDYKKNLNRLYTGLTYTAMQLQLINKFDPKYGFATVNDEKVEVKENFRKFHSILSENFEATEIFVTRESNGATGDYLSEIKTEFLDSELKSNILNATTFEVESKLDEDYTDVSLLTDGIPGLKTDYHTGWLIVSAEDLVAKITVPNEAKSYRFAFNFLVDERLKLNVPEKIEILVNGKIVKTITNSQKITQQPERVSLETTLDLEANANLLVKIYRNKTHKKFACDEIYLYK